MINFEKIEDMSIEEILNTLINLISENRYDEENLYVLAKLKDGESFIVNLKLYICFIAYVYKSHYHRAKDDV